MIETLEVKSVAPVPPKEKLAPEIPQGLKTAFDQSPESGTKMVAALAIPPEADGEQIGKALVKGLKAYAAKNKEAAWGAGFEISGGLIRLWWSRRKARKEKR